MGICAVCDVIWEFGSGSVSVIHSFICGFGSVVLRGRLGVCWIGLVGSGWGLWHGVISCWVRVTVVDWE